MKKILIADDMMFTQQLYGRALKDLPVRCYFASDGLEAARMAGQLQPDLILMDYLMPRMRGDEVTAAVRAMPGGEKTVILALTVEAPERVRRLNLFDGFLLKPVRLSLLEWVVRDALGLAQPGGETPVEFRWQRPRTEKGVA